MHRASSSKLVLLAIFATALTVLAQEPTTKVTAEDYAHAEKFLGYNTNPLVYGIVKPTWMPDDRFWYRRNGADGIQFVIVDAKGTHTPAFDHAKVAAALSAVAGKPFEATKLPMGELAEDAQSVTFMVGPKRFKCDAQGTKCEAVTQDRGRNEILSPDKKRAAFIRDWNLWVRDVASGQETQLTKDGVKDYGYATDNAGWIHSDRPILVWSPDSKKIATFQQDQRKTGELYLVSTAVGHPKLEQWKYPLPGDENVTMIERVIIDVDSPKVVRLQMPPDQHRGTLCDHLICRGTDWDDVQWSPDATKLAFVSTSRDHRQENLRIADASTGAVRDVLEEKVATYYESGNGAVNWRYLPDSNEIIWYSERDNWGQLYLYDLNGKLKNQITTGEGQAAQVLRVDEKNRLVYFVGLGKEKGRDPYFPHLYRIGFDGKNQQLLTPENANHDIALSKSGKYFVDSYSKPDVPQVARTSRYGWKDDRDSRENGHLEAGGDGMETAYPDRGEGSRRRHRPLRPDVPTDESDSEQEVSDHQSHLSGATGRQCRDAGILTSERRLPGAGRVGIHRGRDRWDGESVALEEVPRLLFREHGRQHSARPDRRE